MHPVHGTARAMLSAIFIASSVPALKNPGPYASRAQPATDWFTSLPRRDQRLSPDRLKVDEDLVRLNAAVQLVGGLLLATGRLKRAAAALLAGTLVPTTATGHSFWLESDPGRRREQQIHFLKNLGLFGGLLLAVLDTEGRPSLRWRAHSATGWTRRFVRWGRQIT